MYVRTYVVMTSLLTRSVSYIGPSARRENEKASMLELTVHITGSITQMGAIPKYFSKL